MDSTPTYGLKYQGKANVNAMHTAKV